MPNARILLRSVFAAIWLIGAEFPAYALGPCDWLFFKKIQSRLVDRDYVPQAQACSRTGKCVTLLIDKPSNRPRVSQEQLAFLFKNGGKVVDHIDSNNPSVNCHSFACSQIGLNFPRNAWLDANMGYITILREVLTDTSIQYQRSDFARFGRDPKIKEGDLVVMMGAEREIQHSAVVVKVNGENWVESKLEESAVALTPLPNLADFYFVESLKIFRRLEDSPNNGKSEPMRGGTPTKPKLRAVVDRPMLFDRWYELLSAARFEQFEISLGSYHVDPNQSDLATTPDGNPVKVKVLIEALQAAQQDLALPYGFEMLGHGPLDIELSKRKQLYRAIGLTVRRLKDESR